MISFSLRKRVLISWVFWFGSLRQVSGWRCLCSVLSSGGVLVRREPSVEREPVLSVGVAVGLPRLSAEALAGLAVAVAVILLAGLAVEPVVAVAASVGVFGQVRGN